MRVGSLFAGIGGFDLGFERAGFEIAWQVEIDPFCRAVLAKHWPDVRRYEDVRTVGRELPAIDVLCGGFPCQPHSLAGRRGGATDERDLWPSYARLIRELRPRWVVAENVPGLLSSDAGRFFGTVLGDLAACGYDAEWDCVPASAVGAPHQRDRVWIVAYPMRAGGRQDTGSAFSNEGADEGGAALHHHVVAGGREDVADASRQRPQWPGHEPSAAIVPPTGQLVFCAEVGNRQWEPEPDVGRVAHGVPNRVDRLKSLGNAVVPQITEWIARRILEAEQVINSSRAAAFIETPQVV